MPPQCGVLCGGVPGVFLGLRAGFFKLDVDFGAVACFAGTVAVHDNDSFTFFAFAGDDVEINILADDRLSRAVFDGMREGKVLKIIADVSVAGNAEAALVAGFLRCSARRGYRFYPGLWG